MKNYETEVIDYFKSKAEKYDLVDQQIYWVLSDKLLWHFFKKNILNKLPESFVFLDAGGGTGRWSLKILQEFPKTKGLIFDLSRAMTEQAINKAENLGYMDRLKVVNGNLNEVATILEAYKFDVVFNFHNVLGFVDIPEETIGNLSSLLKSEGYLVSLLPNKYHCLYFNLINNHIPDAKILSQNDEGRFASGMPYINLFTPQMGKELYESNRLTVEYLTGFPNFIYPGYQETRLEGSTANIESIIKNNFDIILKIEIDHLDCGDIAARGNNIFIAGKKNK